ncbi:MAG: hypothetical protein QOG54_576 [Actinomycetota bacterium]|jgi:hypothetical protein|nr:hypothetical protein [Actinomycetota bacterium]
MDSSVRPARVIYGSSGISVRSGQSLPFKLTREWLAPAGYYAERWYLVRPETKEVMYESPERLQLMWGLQAPTSVIDEIHEPIDLPAGSYVIVFALGGIKGGELAFEAVEVPAEEAA